MKIKRLFSKPRWQHKDATIRATAVAESRSPELLAELSVIATEDPEPEVRLAAVRRLHRADQLLDIASSDNSPKVNQRALKLAWEILCGESSEIHSSEELLRMSERVDSPASLEILAKKASQKMIRERAQSRINKDGLLGDLVLTERDPDLRRTLVNRIGQQSTLERVIRQTRKTDKVTHRAATLKLQGIRIEEGDEEALSSRALQLCQTLETAVTNHDLTAMREALSTADQAWETLKGRVKGVLESRFSGARGVLLETIAQQDPKQRDALQRQLADEKENLISTCAEAFESPPDPHRVPEVSRAITTLENRWKQFSRLQDKERERQLGEQYSALKKRASAWIDEAEEQAAIDPVLEAILSRAEQLERRPLHKLRSKELTQLEQDLVAHKATRAAVNNREKRALIRVADIAATRSTALATRSEEAQSAAESMITEIGVLEKQLEEKNLHAAGESLHRIFDLQKVARDHHLLAEDNFSSRFSSARAQADELRNWQRWSNDRIRVRLCEELEQFATSTPHPDAVAEKVRLAQQEWKRLEQSEHLPGERRGHSAGPRLWRRFRAACDTLYKPAKGYFEKRAAIQKRHRSEANDLIAELRRAVEDQIDDHQQLEKLVRQAHAQLRNLDTLPPRDRGNTANRIRKAIDLIKPTLDEHDQTVEEAKRKIIAEAELLVPLEPLSEAIDKAKALQHRWKQAGRTRRSVDQKLWKAFRKQCDAVFERLEEERTHSRKEHKAKLAEANALCQAMESLSSGGGDSISEIEKERRRLQGEWHALKCDHRGVAGRFEEAVESLDQHLMASARESAERTLEDQMQLAELCRQIEKGIPEKEMESAKEKWSALAGELSEAVEGLEQRFQKALDAYSAGDTPDGEEEQALTQALNLCIRMEFIGGVESPGDYQSQRMDYQVKRLSDRMSGGSKKRGREEYQEIWTGWLTNGPLPAEQSDGLQERFERAERAYREANRS